MFVHRDKPMMKYNPDIRRESIAQLYDRSESTVGTQIFYYSYNYLNEFSRGYSARSAAFQQNPDIPVEPLNITDNTLDNENTSLQIPTQRFRHIVSSTAPKYIKNQLARECSVCCLLKPESEYRALLTEDCRHSHRTTCYECIYHSIVILLGSNISIPITCPELTCAARLSEEDVRQILMYYENVSLLNKYDTYLTNTLLEKMPEFIWCAHGCGSGQLHPSIIPQVNCVACNRSTCFVHRVPWHEGLTCDEYDRFGSSNTILTLKYLKKFTKKCPKCKVNIEKNDGCDHMTCTHCSTEFCWNCLAKFRRHDSLYTCAHERTCTYFQRMSINPEQPIYEFNHRRSLRSTSCIIL